MKTQILAVLALGTSIAMAQNKKTEPVILPANVKVKIALLAAPKMSAEMLKSQDTTKKVMLLN